MNARTNSFDHDKQIKPTDRIAILGASRGLGWTTYRHLLELQSDADYFLSSRKIEQRRNEITGNTVLFVQDFSKPEIDPEFLKALEEFHPTRLIYAAGGGPYGAFQSKNWADHMWALNTSFLYPAQLLHQILGSLKLWPDLKQIVFIGSDIAENKPDPNAASYAAAKHALKGLISTVQVESSNTSGLPEILLFSPGYMQTDMLPVNSAPRLRGLAEAPLEVAKKLIAVIEKNNQR